MRVIAFALLYIFSIHLVSAQQELGTSTLGHVWQVNQLNPGVIPNSKFVVSLPGVYNNLRITNITLEDLEGQNQEGKKVLDIDNAINQLADQDNIIRENLAIQTLGFGMALGDFFIQASHGIRFNGFINYPKTFPQLVWQGNGQFVGQTVEFGPDFHLEGFHEWSLGLAYQVNDNISVGGRFKLLSGIAYASTEKTFLSLTTDEEFYELELDTDYLINSSNSFEYGGFDDLNLDFSFEQLDSRDLFTDNAGAAFDIGVDLQFEKFSIGLSAIGYRKNQLG